MNTNTQGQVVGWFSFDIELISLRPVLFIKIGRTQNAKIFGALLS